MKYGTERRRKLQDGGEALPGGGRDDGRVMVRVVNVVVRCPVFCSVRDVSRTGKTFL